MMTKIISSVLILVFVLTTLLLARPESQWRGPNRNGIYPEKNLIKKWPADGPKLLWKAEGIGEGFSSVALAYDKVYINGAVNGNGIMHAFDLKGKLLWKKNYGSEWSGDFPGTRSTPTVVDGLLYVHSGNSTMVCMDAETGKIVWSVDLKKKIGADPPRWGIAESVVIDGNKVICTPGSPKASIIALDRLKGTTIWECTEHTEKGGYCSPVIITHNKQRILVTMTARSIVALNPETGKLLWKHEHRTNWDVNANTPIYKDGMLYCVSGYGTGGVMLKLAADGKSVTEVWRNPTLDSQIGATVVVNGYIYGSGMKKKYWQCLDWKTGAVKWQSPSRGKGNIVYADGRLYLYDENSKVMLVEPNPIEFKEISSFKVTLGTGNHWAHLVIANGRLFVRHGDALMVYRISNN
jgi:outer membrane protein assembly factor BamB